MASNLRAMACCFFQETLTTLPRHVTQRLTATSCERASPPASGLNEEISKGPTGYNSDNLPAELTPAIPITFHLPFLALFISQSTAPPNIPVLWLLASFHTLPFKFPKSLMQVLISFPCRQRKKKQHIKKTMFAPAGSCRKQLSMQGDSSKKAKACSKPLSTL